MTSLRSVLLASGFALSMLGSVAQAQEIKFDFTPGTIFDLPTVPASYAVSGSFVYDTVAKTLSGVDVVFVGTNGTYTFPTGIVETPTDLIFSNDGANDLPEFYFENSLAFGGVDAITGGALPSNGSLAVIASGAVSAAPELNVWALMLAGVAMIGLTLRQVRVRRASLSA